jgi:hypothetical protein
MGEHQPLRLAPLARAQPFEIEGPAGRLEALLEDPGRYGPDAVGIACHPHPLDQGTLRNKVVHTLARAYNELGLPALRFNFRGVGRSEGRYGALEGETADAHATVAWARERWPGVPIWIGGFSFGALVAFRVASEAPSIGRLVTIAPPVQRFALPEVRRPECPWLIVQGSRDEIVDCKAVRAWAGRFSPTPELVVLEGAGHFFHGRLTGLRETLVRKLGPLQLPP